MSYCIFQNTREELKGACRKLEQGEVIDWSPEERRALKTLVDLCTEVLEHVEDLQDELDAHRCEECGMTIEASKVYCTECDEG
jgi:hypothetical protein